MCLGVFIKKRFTPIILSILIVTLYYVLRTKDLKIYANNANTDLAPNIVYLLLSSLLLIYTFFIKVDKNGVDAYLEEVIHRDTPGMPKKSKWNHQYR